MHRGIICWATAASLLAIAATPSPPATPMPMATPSQLSSFSAAGWLSLKAAAREKVASLQAVIRFAHRGRLTRIELGDVSATANSGKGNVVMPFPAGTITAVIDRTKELFIAWSSRRLLYYQSKLTAATLGSMSALNKLSAFTKYQLLTFSLNLTGHQPVDGRMASVFEFDAKVQKQGGKVQSAVGHVALADDLSGLPIHTDVTMGAGEPSTVTMQMDLTSISTNTPPASEFATPRGYKKVKNFVELLMTLAPLPPPRHRPTPEAP
jgi:hypothetical protein